MSDDVNDIPYKPMPPNAVHKGTMTFGASNAPENPLWQKCPVCNGTALVSIPPHVAGDAREFSTTSSGPWPCKVCDGLGMVCPKILTDGEMASRELIAALRGYAGKLRAAIREAYDELADTDHVVGAVLYRALEIPSPDDPA